MKLLLTFSLVFLSFSTFAQSLLLRKDNIKKQYVTKSDFKNIEGIKSLKVQNVWRKYNKTYEGVEFYKLLDKVYGKSWRNAKSISFKALDGYTQTTTIPLMLKMSIGKTGLIATNEEGQSGFSKFVRNKKEVALGPFYLVWSNFSVDDKASHVDALKWPYQLKEINIDF